MPRRSPWTILVVLAAPRAWADTDLVVTGERRLESAHSAVIRTDVVSRREAERRGATHVGDALAGQLGVQVNPGAYGFLGAPSAIQIAGLDRERVLVLEDGERVIGDSGGAIDLASLPLTDVARVEVVSGPTSALYGAGALGGVVHVLTAPPPPGSTARLRLEGRTHAWWLGQGRAAVRSGMGFVVADVSLSRRDGLPRGEDRPDLLVPASRRWLVGLRAGAGIGRATVTLRARWLHDALDGLETQTVPGLGTYRVDLPLRTHRLALQLVDLLDLGKGASLRLSLARQWVFAEAGKDRFASPLDEVRRRSQGLSSAEATLALPADGFHLVSGVRAEIETFAQRLDKTVAIDARGRLATTSAAEIPALTSASGALYAQGTFDLPGGCKLLGGARAELHRRYGLALAPRLAATCAAGRARLRVGVGRGFRSPSGKELGFSFDHSFYGYRVLGTAELGPETSWGATSEVTVEGPDRLVVRLGAFANWIDDLVDVVPVGAATDGVTTYRYENVGKARTAGLQIDATWPLRPFARVELGHTYLSTRDEATGAPLPSRPPHTLRASLRLVAREVEVVLRLRVVSEAWVADGVHSPAYSLLDGRIEKRLGGAWTVHGGVLNAFGVRPLPGRPGDQRPFDGRVFYVGVTAELPAEEP